MPIIGQLLGHLLLLLSFKEEETSHLALDALCLLFQFKYQQHCKRICGGMDPPAHQHHPVALLVFLTSLQQTVLLLAGGTTLSPALPFLYS